MIPSFSVSAIIRPNGQLTYLHIKDMVFHMKTTLNIHDSVMRKLREASGRRGMTMSALVEAGLRRVLDEDQTSMREQKRLVELPSWAGGEARVDICNREALYAAMEET